MEDQEQPRRLSPEWVAGKLNSIEAKLDKIMEGLNPKPAVTGPKKQPVKKEEEPKQIQKVVFDHLTERCYVVHPEP